jgi:hypothetical protein
VAALIALVMLFDVAAFAAWIFRPSYFDKDSRWDSENFKATRAEKIVRYLKEPL